jgi:hypothetical protein
VVLLILAIVWAAVLGPSLLRRRAERRSTDSIGAFHRHLRVLERAGPVTVDPAHRLAQTESPRARRRPGIPGRSGALRSDPYFRPGACRRRRNVLSALLTLLVFTGALGVIPSLRPALFATIAGAVLLLGYVGLLIYLRNLALEREMKLRYLPHAREPESSVVIRRVAAR